MTDPSRWLDPVAEVARAAGEVALGYFKTEVAVERKRDGSPVTIADREAERVARAWIAERFPDDAVLGEEFGGSALGTRHSALGGAQAERRCWLIDPIDGTRSFVAGVPLWGTLIAVAEGDTIVAGAIYCAAAGELVVAATGAGCWWNGTRCGVSTVSDLAHATVLTTDDRFPERPDRRAKWAYLAERSQLARTWGDAYGYLLVATGRAEVMVDDRMNPWDVAPLIPVIGEAGGQLTDWRGRVTAFGGDAIATNAALDAAVRGLLVEELRT